MSRLNRIPLLAPAGLVLAGAVFLLAALGKAPAAPPPPAPMPPPLGPGLSAVAMLGRKMFFDARLSASGRLSCASCHDPRNHYAPDNARPVQPGGADLRRFGRRAVPTLTYKDRTPPFTIGPENPAMELNEASPQAVARGGAAARGVATFDPRLGPARATPPRKIAGRTTLAAPVPRGGFFWDGRVDTLEDQAKGPLFTRFEMANTPAALARTLRRAYGPRLAALFGKSVLGDDGMLISEAAFALARYQIEDPSFHPYSSKYDAYLAGRARLTPAEARGLKIFNDPKTGNCAACHLDKPGPDGSPPLFTDFEYEALGVPRNPAIPANARKGYYDLGLCGPLRHDAIARKPAYCGLFKTPTLRNVATRRAFFHNGIYHSLRQVLDFYARRDSDPGAIYPRRDGKVQRFDDLPASLRANVDRTDTPFGRKPGQGPALTEAQESDLIAFLKTLTDGYRPTHR